MFPIFFNEIDHKYKVRDSRVAKVWLLPEGILRSFSLCDAPYVQT